MRLCQANPQPIQACCAARTRLPRRPAHLCGACGRSGCRCHIAERASLALPLDLVAGDLPRRAQHSRQIFTVILAPQIQPRCPQAPPLPFSEPLSLQFGKGTGHHGPYT